LGIYLRILVEDILVKLFFVSFAVLLLLALLSRLFINLI
jgi:hypothetical protein